MSEISFGNIILAHSGKKGILRPNEKGVYPLNAGGFNIPNGIGISYPANEYVIEQMKENSDLQRRVSMGYCKMEVNHPEPYIYVEENGIRYRKEMTDVLQWIARLRDYDDLRICGLISRITFRPEDDNDYTKPIWNTIECEPFGNRGPEFKESLDNPRHNTAVSIRTQIDPWRPGETRKNVVYWTSYDWVHEPGMIHANKHMTAGLESFADQFEMSVDNVQKFRQADVIERLDECIRLAANDPTSEALMRVGGMEALNDMSGILERIKRNYVPGDTMRAGVSFSSIF